MYLKFLILCSFITCTIAPSRLFAYDPRYVLHRWVNRHEDTPESAALLRPIAHNFIKDFNPGDFDHTSRFYLGGALLEAIEKNKLNLASVLVDCKPDYNVRSDYNHLRELNIMHFCALYLPDTARSVRFISHVISQSSSKLILELLSDSKRWQRSEVILPIDIAKKYHKDKIAGFFRELSKNRLAI